MSPKKLTTAADLNYYRGHQAYIRTFKYTPLNQFDHLLCIHGDWGQGTTGEVAYFILSAAAYDAIAARFPVEERELGLHRSDFFAVGEVLALVQLESPAPASE